MCFGLFVLFLVSFGSPSWQFTVTFPVLFYAAFVFGSADACLAQLELVQVGVRRQLIENGRHAIFMHRLRAGILMPGHGRQTPMIFSSLEEPPFTP